MTNMHEESKTSFMPVSSAPRLNSSEDATARGGDQKKSARNEASHILRQTKQVKDIHAKKPNPHMEGVKDIIQKVRRMRGSNPTSSNLKSISERVQKKQLA